MPTLKKIQLLKNAQANAESNFFKHSIIFASNGEDFAERAGEVAKEYHEEMKRYLIDKKE